MHRSTTACSLLLLELQVLWLAEKQGHCKSSAAAVSTNQRPHTMLAASNRTHGPFTQVAHLLVTQTKSSAARIYAPTPLHIPGSGQAAELLL